MIALDDLKLAVLLPTYDGTRHNGLALMDLASSVRNYIAVEQGSSLLAFGFNQLLCRAHALCADGMATHALMLHADVCPVGEGWFRRFWKLFQERDAQIMSAIIPVKSNDGFTSTAIAQLGPARARRLTMTEIHRNGFPQTFTDPNLLLNTGLMLFRLDEPWLKKCAFKVRDGIEWIDGVPVPSCYGEDWDFTRQARANGCDRIYATSAIDVVHYGRQGWPSTQTWGLERDDGSRP